MVFPSEVYPYQQTMYFRDKPDLMCRNKRSTVYSRTSAVALFERLRLLDGNVSTSKTEFTLGFVRAWRGSNKRINVGIAGARDTRSIDTVLGILSSSMVKVWN